MRKTALLLTAIATFLFLAGGAGAAILTNSGFEFANFNGWTERSNPSGSIIYGSSSPPLPKEGTYFAYLGSWSTPTEISQTFHMDAGQTLTGWAYWDWSGYSNGEQRGYVELYDNNNELIATPWQRVNGTGEILQWESWSFSATYTGDFTLVLGTADSASGHTSHSAAYFDGMTIVPIPGGVWLLGSGMLGLAGIRRNLKPRG